MPCRTPRTAQEHIILLYKSSYSIIHMVILCSCYQPFNIQRKGEEHSRIKRLQAQVLQASEVPKKEKGELP